MLKSGQLYCHYKGHLYRIIGIAKHSETLENLVIYCREGDDGDIWARPQTMFEEKLEDGRFRFELIEE